MDQRHRYGIAVLKVLTLIYLVALVIVLVIGIGIIDLVKIIALGQLVTIYVLFYTKRELFGVHSDIKRSQSNIEDLIRTNQDLKKDVSDNKIRIKEAELRLYKQIESRDRLKVLLSEKQFNAIGSMRGWAISPDLALILYEAINNKKTVNIVEAGSGVSTLILASAIVNKSIKGHVYSLEHEQNYLEKTFKKVQEGGLGNVVSMLYAPIEKIQIGNKTWKWFSSSAVSKLPSKIDLLFIDSPPGSLQEKSRYPAMPILYDRLADDAIVILDDYNRSDEKTIVQSWIKSYGDLSLEEISSDHGTAILKKMKDV